MLVAQFNLSSRQLKVLLTFRVDRDTRSVERHGFLDVDCSVATMKQLCREGYLRWHESTGRPGTADHRPPGYSITAKGEMFLRIVEQELRDTLAWFEGQDLPVSHINGAQADVVAGKAEITAKGKYRRKKPA